MEKIGDWAQAYSARHLNPINRTVNWICVPQWVFAIWLGLKCIPLGTAAVNAATLTALGTWAVYFRLSRPLALGMAIVLPLVYWAVVAVEDLVQSYAPVLALAIFVEAWVSQWVGRDVEGHQPGLREESIFMLVSPLWLLADVYRACNWRWQSA